MKSAVFGGAEGDGLLFVMGWSNRLEGENERWFIDRLANEGYRVHAIQLPTDIADFDREYLRPVQRYHDAHEPSVVVGHSLGGLIAAHLETDVAVTDSPFVIGRLGTGTETNRDGSIVLAI